MRVVRRWRRVHVWGHGGSLAEKGVERIRRAERGRIVLLHAIIALLKGKWRKHLLIVARRPVIGGSTVLASGTRSDEGGLDRRCQKSPAGIRHRTWTAAVLRETGRLERYGVFVPTVGTVYSSIVSVQNLHIRIHAAIFEAFHTAVVKAGDATLAPARGRGSIAISLVCSLVSVAVTVVISTIWIFRASRATIR